MNKHGETSGSENAIPRGYLRLKDGTLCVDTFDFGAIVDDVHASNLHNIDLGDFTLSPAEADERDLIQASLESAKAGFSTTPKILFQTMVAADGKTNSFHGAEKENWRFCVVRTKPKCETPYYKIEQALRISDADLMVGPWVKRTNGIVQQMGAMQPIATRLNETFQPQSVGFDLDRLQAAIRARMEFSESTFPAIDASLDRFTQLDRVPIGDLKLLGYFSILESLLSHAPKSNESADSISRQLTRNLILVHNRCPDGYGLGLDEATCKASKLVNKLYALRSAIAHGNDQPKAIDQLNQVLPSLSPRHNIDAFVRRLLRRTLERALIEPALLTDLKG